MLWTFYPGFAQNYYYTKHLPGLLSLTTRVWLPEPGRWSRASGVRPLEPARRNRAYGARPMEPARSEPDRGAGRQNRTVVASRQNRVTGTMPHSIKMDSINKRVKKIRDGSFVQAGAQCPRDAIS
jgi:hypothetical protein